MNKIAFMEGYMMKQAIFGVGGLKAIQRAKSWGSKPYTYNRAYEGTMWDAPDMENTVGQIRSPFKGVSRHRELYQDTMAAGKTGKKIYDVAKNVPKAGGMISRVGAVGSKIIPAAQNIAGKLPGASTIGKVVTSPAAKLGLKTLGKGLGVIGAIDMGLDAGQQLFTDPRTGGLSGDVIGNIQRNAENVSRQNLENMKGGFWSGLGKNVQSGAFNPMRNIIAFNATGADTLKEWGKVGWNAMFGPDSSKPTTRADVDAAWEHMRQNDPENYKRLMAKKQQNQQAKQQAPAPAQPKPQPAPQTQEIPTIPSKNNQQGQPPQQQQALPVPGGNKQ